MIRVLIAGDQPLVRTGIRTILDGQNQLEVVGVATDCGPELVEQSRSLGPDVILIDVRKPSSDALDAIRRSIHSGRAGNDAPRVLVLAAFDTDDDMYATLYAGVSGVLVKDCAAEDLVSAVHIVAAHQALLSPAITRQLLTSLVAVRPAPAPAGALELLTSREQEVLRLLTTGRSNAEIAAYLFISEQTAKTHVRRVLNKLKLRDRVHAVVFGYENGVAVPGQRRP